MTVTLSDKPCVFCLATNTSGSNITTTNQYDAAAILLLSDLMGPSERFAINSEEPIPLCSASDCQLFFKEIQRSAAIWVDVCSHLYQNVLPNAQRKILSTRNRFQEPESLFPQDGFSHYFRNSILYNGIPSKIQVILQTPNKSLGVPVQVSPQTSNICRQISYPLLQIESEEWALLQRRQNFHPTSELTTLATVATANSSNTTSDYGGVYELLEASNIVAVPYTTNGAETVEVITEFLEDETAIDYDNYGDIEEDEYDAPSAKRRKKNLTTKKRTRTLSPKKKKTTKSTSELVKKKRNRIKRPPPPLPRRRKIKCKFCPFLCLYPHLYRKHEQGIHRNLLLHSCLHCQEIFSSEEFLKAHTIIHIPPTPNEYPCNICGKQLKKPHKLRKHLVDVHIPNFLDDDPTAFIQDDDVNESEFKCNICGMEFRGRKHFLNHQNRHFKRHFKCELCDNFDTKVFTEYLDHLYKTHENADKTHQCPKCSKKFAYRLIYDRHVKYHSIEMMKPLSCCFCEDRFALDEQETFDKHQSTCVILSNSNNSQSMSSKSTDAANPTPQSTHTDDSSTPVTVTTINTTANTSVSTTVADIKVSGLSCGFCGKIFPRGKDLLLARHEWSHPELLVHQCTHANCGKKFCRRTFLETHLSTHLEQGPYLCTNCPLIATTSEELTKHLVQEHSGEATLICPEPDCGRTFSHVSSLHYHQTAVHASRQRFKCSHCERTFNVKYKLKLHTERIHPETLENGPQKFPCDLCGKNFIRPNILRQHILRKHEKVRKRATCEICGKIVTYQLLKEHMAHHAGEKNYLCTVCGKQFTWKNTLREHIRAVHEKDRPMHECPHCDQKYGRRDQMKRHISYHHPLDADGNVIIKKVKDSKPKPPRIMDPTRRKQKITPKVVYPSSSSEQPTQAVILGIESFTKAMTMKTIEPTSDKQADKDKEASERESETDESLMGCVITPTATESPNLRRSTRLTKRDEPPEKIVIDVKDEDTESD